MDVCNHILQFCGWHRQKVVDSGCMCIHTTVLYYENCRKETTTTLRVLIGFCCSRFCNCWPSQQHHVVRLMVAVWYLLLALIFWVFHCIDFNIIFVRVFFFLFICVFNVIAAYVAITTVCNKIKILKNKIFL